MRAFLPLPKPNLNVLAVYFGLLYLATSGMIFLFWSYVPPDTFSVGAYTLAATGGYAGLYLLLPVCLTAILTWASVPFFKERGRVWVAYTTAYLSGSTLLVLLYADYRLYELYEYHFNDFVWNLITTSGGIAALGATDSTTHTVALQVVMFYLGAAAAFWLIQRFALARPLLNGKALLGLSAFLALVLVSEEGVYAYSTHTGREEVVRAAEVVPYHLHTSATHFLKHLGIPRTAMSNLRIASGKVEYPGHNLKAKSLAHYPNLIMLVAESFRWDLLDPEITPNLWRLSQRSSRFEQHYSGGNRTRMGLFSMFYGLYAPYWYSFEAQRISPALMDHVRAHDYQLAIHTSQSFDYPELRHTVFTGIPESYLQEIKTGEPWQRDRTNISDIIQKLGSRDPRRPFYGFMFFESTHAPYNFPEDSVIRPDYERDMNYLKINLQENARKIHARYINAAHHIDREVGRLLEYLEQNRMMDDTIILFTGDHGEEFMEKGHWGHGHDRSFPEEQIRVPLVLHVPGKAAEVISRRTSHLQISQTLLQMLGVEQDPRSYSSASTLSGDLPYFVAGDYDYMSILDDRYKITFPFTGSDYFRYAVHDAQDRPIPREARRQIVEQYQSLIDEVTRESQRFVR